MHNSIGQLANYQSWSFITVHGQWSILIQWISYRSDLVNTKESVLPVCDKHYHTNNRNLGKGRRLKFCVTMHSNKVIKMDKFLLCKATKFIIHSTRTCCPRKLCSKPEQDQTFNTRWAWLCFYILTVTWNSLVKFHIKSLNTLLLNQQWIVEHCHVDEKHSGLKKSTS